MHWEKVPLNIGGKDIMKEQLDEANRQDIPFRLVRFRQRDGKKYFIGKSWLVK